MEERRLQILHIHWLDYAAHRPLHHPPLTTLPTTARGLRLRALPLSLHLVLDTGLLLPSRNRRSAGRSPACDIHPTCRAAAPPYGVPHLSLAHTRAQHLLHYARRARTLADAPAASRAAHCWCLALCLRAFVPFNCVAVHARRACMLRPTLLPPPLLLAPSPLTLCALPAHKAQRHTHHLYPTPTSACLPTMPTSSHACLLRTTCPLHTCLLHYRYSPTPLPTLWHAPHRTPYARWRAAHCFTQHAVRSLFGQDGAGSFLAAHDRAFTARHGTHLGHTHTWPSCGIHVTYGTHRTCWDWCHCPHVLHTLTSHVDTYGLPHAHGCCFPCTACLCLLPGMGRYARRRTRDDGERTHCACTPRALHTRTHRAPAPHSARTAPCSMPLARGAHCCNLCARLPSRLLSSYPRITALLCSFTISYHHFCVGVLYTRTPTHTVHGDCVCIRTGRHRNSRIAYYYLTPPQEK